MASLLERWYPKLSIPFKTQHYLYQCNTSVSDTRIKVQDLLCSKYYRGSPNITGSLKSNSFYAFHKWTMIRIKGGGEPVWMNGVFDPINQNTSVLHLKLECHPSFWVIAILSPSLILFIFLLIAVEHFSLSYQQWSIAIGVSIIMTAVFAINWVTVNSLKTDLRQTFEENMGITPIDTHSM